MHSKTPRYTRFIQYLHAEVMWSANFFEAVIYSGSSCYDGVYKKKYDRKNKAEVKPSYEGVNTVMTNMSARQSVGNDPIDVRIFQIFRMCDISSLPAHMRGIYSRKSRRVNHCAHIAHVVIPNRFGMTHGSKNGPSVHTAYVHAVQLIHTRALQLENCARRLQR